MFLVQGSEIRVSGFWFLVSGFGFRVPGLADRVCDADVDSVGEGELPPSPFSGTPPGTPLGP